MHKEAPLKRDTKRALNSKSQNNLQPKPKYSKAEQQES
jgi:hypothetical protein